MTFSKIAFLMAALAIIPSGCVEQPVPPVADFETAEPVLSEPQLDQLVAPVALYPDPLLADILTASTYPLEVVEAQRWIGDAANASLKGDALTAVLTAQDWAPSVKALVPFPPILKMMNDHLDWVQRLGEAFLAQQADVMDAVQRLRGRAQSAGSLKSLPQQTVARDGDAVLILPPAPETVYVPVYDPWCVYGPWPDPAYPPVYFSPWSGYCLPADYLVGFDAGIFVSFGFWDWGRFDWKHHDIRIDRDRFGRFHPGHEPSGEIWRHDPGHRGGVPYRDPRNARQFLPNRDYHQSFRGYEGRGGDASRSVRPAPPAFGEFGSGRDIRAQSARGQASRQGMPSGFSRGFGGGGGRGGGRR
ncbi:MAG TPA: DUF3300 domain-containing protein [Aliidongia sp.]|nr:DUF3300 domain-containing protein [Aliidongia sp.]